MFETNILRPKHPIGLSDTPIQKVNLAINHYPDGITKKAILISPNVQRPKTDDRLSAVAAKSNAESLFASGILPRVEFNNTLLKDPVVNKGNRAYLRVGADVAHGVTDELSHHMDHVLTSAVVGMAGTVVAEAAGAAATAFLAPEIVVGGTVFLGAAGLIYGAHELYKHAGSWAHAADVVVNSDKYNAAEITKSHKDLQGLGAGSLDFAAGSLSGNGLAVGIKKYSAAAASEIVSSATAVDTGNTNSIIPTGNAELPHEITDTAQLPHTHNPNVKRVPPGNSENPVGDSAVSKQKQESQPASKRHNIQNIIDTSTTDRDIEQLELHGAGAHDKVKQMKHYINNNATPAENYLIKVIKENDVTIIGEYHLKDCPNSHRILGAKILSKLPRGSTLAVEYFPSSDRAIFEEFNTKQGSALEDILHRLGHHEKLEMYKAARENGIRVVPIDDEKFEQMKALTTEHREKHMAEQVLNLF